MKFGISIIIAIITLLPACTEEAQAPAGCGAMPKGNRTVFVRIIAINANPKGADDYSEAFTIKNFGSEPVNLDGWKVTHNGESQWDLGSVKELKPCHQVTIINLNEESMNNTHDYLKLVNNKNIQVQNVEWDSTSDGKEIVPE